MRKNKGITLVALIITIVVMLILIAVSVNVLIKSNLIGTAEKTVEKYNKVAEEEGNGGTIEIDGKKYASIEDYMEGNEQYDPDGWIMAWTCADGGSWSDTIEEGGTAEGDIVAKLYKTGNKITPSSFEFNGKICTFNEGDEYNLVIEGTGTMGALMTTDGSNITGATGWHKSTAMYMMGASDTCIMPYVSKIVVGKGIKNIGGYAFGGDTGLKKISLSSEITSINDCAFMYCTNLTSIKIPENVMSIGFNAFYNCESLTSVSIPSGVTSIGDRAFYNCASLSKIKVLATNATVEEYAFGGLASNSKIYVLNDTMKTRVEAAIDKSETTVEVVTEEQMKSL